MERLKELLPQAKREGRMMGVLFVDLDRFKRINDTLGHSTGDRLLRCVGERFREVLQPELAHEREVLMARFGGDEFVFLITALSSREALEAVAVKLLHALGEPFQIGGHELVASASIGMALYPEDGEDAESLIKNTDQAMYQVKDKGGNGFKRFIEGLGGHNEARLQLESEMRYALQDEQFELFYQPKLDLHNWGLVGAEALIRWRHPERGLVSPGQFIPLAEETGLIVPMGEWALRQACLDAQRWRGMGMSVGRMAVNLSPKQFAQRDLIERVQEILAETGLPPEFLELEVTESMVMTNLDEAIAVLRQLRAMGISISVDDFGTGHSSLNYLRRLPIDTLKIDRSFMMGVEVPGSDEQVIASTIIALGQTLRLNVIAEGVETLQQLRFLSEAGCHEMQGYLISKPVPQGELDRFMAHDMAPLVERLERELLELASQEEAPGKPREEPGAALRGLSGRS